jgi:hypothetical protein
MYATLRLYRRTPKVAPAKYHLGATYVFYHCLCIVEAVFSLHFQSRSAIQLPLRVMLVINSGWRLKLHCNSWLNNRNGEFKVSWDAWGRWLEGQGEGDPSVNTLNEIWNGPAQGIDN